MRTSTRNFSRARALAACLLAAALAAAAALHSPSGRAAARNDLMVTNGNDSGPGSLRQAIADAAPGDAVIIGRFVAVVGLTSGEIVIDKSISIGRDAGGNGAVASTGRFRVFRITSGATVGIEGLTIRDGFASPETDPTNRGGAGIHNSGTLTLVTCIVSNNTTVGGVATSSGLAYGGGGIYNSGTLTMISAGARGNTVRGAASSANFRGDAYGGGIYNDVGGKISMLGSATNNLALGGTGGSTGSEGSAAGGGIYNLGTLDMLESLVSDNRAVGADSASAASSGGGSSGGGIENFGTVTGRAPSIINNIAQAGSAPVSPSTAQGGGIDNRSPGTLALTTAIVSGNFALAGGANADGTPAAASGGGINNLSTATLTNSTVNVNIARGGPVADNNNIVGSASTGEAGGGGVNSAGTLTLTNSTVSSNEAQGGVGRTRLDSPGGKASGGGILAEGTLTLTNSTVTRNAAAGARAMTSSAEGGGVFFRGPGTARPLNNIVAGNFVRGNTSAGAENNTTAAPDVSGMFASQGHNLVGSNDGAQASFPAGTPNASGDIVGTSASPVDAKLGPLVDNGSGRLMFTHRPWPGSPAIDGGDNVVLGAPYNLTTDQRGSGFPRLVNSSVDIGALEFQGSSPTFAFEVAASSVTEGVSPFHVVVTRTGGLEAADTTVDLSMTDGTASSRSDFTPVFATLRFDALGGTRYDIPVFITADAYTEGPETVSLTLSNPTGGGSLGTPATATFTIDNNETLPLSPNPVDSSSFFVSQHYRDFFGRMGDDNGLRFWSAEIDKCPTDSQCRDVARIHASAAFFLSIESGETGFFALRVRRAAFGNRSASSSLRVTLADFLRDSREIGELVIVGVGEWQQRIEEAKQNYLARMVETPAFRARYPETLTAVGYVNALFQSAGVTPTTAERAVAATAYAWGGTSGRAAALRSVTESASVTNAELNPAFVLSEYFGYLRRNPTDAPDTNDTGYQFWLSKLNQFNGDFVKAEMVKAFISSDEYRKRFGNN